MYLDDIDEILHNSDGREATIKRLYALFREGLTNSAAIPEIQTEADQAAHALLGCVEYTALSVIYEAAEDVVADPDVPNDVADVVKAMGDGRLAELCQRIVDKGGPIGEHYCQERK